MLRRSLLATAMFAGVAAVVGFGVVPAARAADKEIAVIIKATDSDFWQYLVVGAENYAKEHPGVHVTVYGPPSETDVEQQVAILENVISKKPAGIVIASSSSDATAPAINNAMKQGIPVVTVDNLVRGAQPAAHLATDNLKAGGQAAERLVAVIKANGKEPKGKVGVISAMAGIEVLTKRDDGFTKRLAEIAPDLKVLPVRYVDNDVQKAMSAANDLMLANPDLLGFFADNNHTGDGVAAAIRGHKGGPIAVVAFDSDPEEVSALHDGVLAGLVVQDPYGMGYKGVDSVIQAMGGAKLPAYTDTGVAVITKETMDEPTNKGLLNPLSLKK
jgi:ribose transport system substrate-binding protein